MNTQTAQNIIQVLLYEGTSVKKGDIAKFLKIETNVVYENILEIKNLLSVLDLKLIESATSLEIVLNQEINSLINKNKVEDLQSELSESALQTLAVILYRTKATAAEINFIRGVDSGRSIKNLLTRGIVEKLEEKSRKYYIVTTETLKYLGLENSGEIGDFTEISAKLKTLIEGQ